ncbi:MAG: DUF4105 domain-containing protein [Prevotella sp.]|nr:DUF4105 domain-containing protein [Prevotella sp.]
MNARRHTLLSRWLFAIIFPALFHPAQSFAQEYDIDVLTRIFADSTVLSATEVSLVTCEPFDRVYSLYGHTGLHISSPEAGIDLLANWGIFDMQQRFFILHFTLGLTDYRMDIEDWGWFCYRYEHYGCGIYEQVLNLSLAEKRRLIDSVLENYKPENRYYRYNYFFDNCTTRVRDIVETAVGGEVNYPAREGRSFRQLIHDWNDTHLWARWGNDFLLGIPADRKATSREAQFLPFNLSGDFEGAVVGGKKLVKTSRWVVAPMYDKGTNSFADEYLLSPAGAAIGYLVLLVLIYAIEVRYRVRLWLFDALVLLATGVPGLLLFVLIFSQHPAVSLNAQILIFNPLALVFLPFILRKLLRGEGCRLLTALAVMAGAGIVCGMTLQHFSEGTLTLALFLIMTYLRRTGATRTNETQQTT